MALSSMRFRDYTWPYNPERYEIAFRRQIAVHKIPFGRYCMQDLGLCYRIMRGEGTFSGSGAYEEFRKLANEFYQDGPGLLVHPVWQPSNAYFIALELLERPLPDYVHYSFEFWEDGLSVSGLTQITAENSSGDTGDTAVSSSSSSSDSGGTYTVKKGDTLWSIAKQYNVTLSALISANPQLKNPNLIYVGDQVYLP